MQSELSKSSVILFLHLFNGPPNEAILEAGLLSMLQQLGQLSLISKLTLTLNLISTQAPDYWFTFCLMYWDKHLSSSCSLFFKAWKTNEVDLLPPQRCRMDSHFSRFRQLKVVTSPNSQLVLSFMVILNVFDDGFQMLPMVFRQFVESHLFKQAYLIFQKCSRSRQRGHKILFSSYDQDLQQNQTLARSLQFTPFSKHYFTKRIAHSHGHAIHQILFQSHIRNYLEFEFCKLQCGARDTPQKW